MRVQKFTTTASRLAYTWQYTDPYNTLARDTEAGKMYLVTSEGSGVATMIPFANEFGYISVPLSAFREVDANGDVSNIAANGGVLASDTTPVLRGDANQAAELLWAASNVDAIAVLGLALPGDFDGSRNVSVICRTYSSTTDAATLSVKTSWDGGALVTDTATGAASATPQNNTATIAAADVPDSPGVLTLQLIPAAHTTDAMALQKVLIQYYRK